MYRLQRGSHHNQHLQNAWNKYGEDAFEFLICEFAKDQSQLDSLEGIYITWDGYYNKRAGGANGKPSEETRKKMRLAQLGKIHSNETKQKISQNVKEAMATREVKSKMRDGLTEWWLERKENGFNGLSEKHKKRISNSLKGKKRGPLSKKTRKKMSESKMGHEVSTETRRKIGLAVRKACERRNNDKT